MFGNKIFSSLALVITAAIWGIGLASQSGAMDTLPPMYFMTLRYVIGSTMLILAITAVHLFRRRKTMFPPPPVPQNAGNFTWEV